MIKQKKLNNGNKNIKKHVHKIHKILCFKWNHKLCQLFKKMNDLIFQLKIFLNQQKKKIKYYNNKNKRLRN